MDVLFRQHLRQGSPQFSAGENESPYEILGISSLDGFDQVKIAYKRKRKDAESSCNCNWEYLLERAYGMVMMDQLLNRKKGMAYGSIKIMCISTLGHANWKPLQFLCFVYFYRILEKLKATESTIPPVYNEYGEVEGRGVHMAKRVLRSLGLVLGSILAASLGYTGLVNFFQFLGQYFPSVVYNFQELIVTTASSVLLCILASYYR